MRVAHVELVRAQRLAAGVAVAADAAGVAEPGQRDAHARLERRASSPGPTRSIDADALVAGDERRRRLDRPLAARGVDVGVAEARRSRSRTSTCSGRARDRQVLDLERAIEAADDGGFHGVPRISLVTPAPSQGPRGEPSVHSAARRVRSPPQAVRRRSVSAPSASASSVAPATTATSTPAARAERAVRRRGRARRTRRSAAAPHEIALQHAGHLVARRRTARTAAAAGR